MRARGPRIVFIPWDATSEESSEWRDKTNQWNTVKNDKFDIVYYDPAQRAHPILQAASSLQDAVIYIRGHGKPGSASLMTKVHGSEVSLLVEDACDRLIGMGLATPFSGAIKFHSCYSGTVFTDTAFTEAESGAQRNVASARAGLAVVDEMIELGKQRLAQAEGDLKKQTRFFGGALNKGKVKAAAEKIEREQRALQQRVAARPATIAKAQADLDERLLRVPTRESIATRGARHMRAQGYTLCRYYGYLGPLESLYAVDTSAPGTEYHKFVNLEGLHELPDRLKGRVSRPGVDLQMIRASIGRVLVP